MGVIEPAVAAAVEGLPSGGRIGVICTRSTMQSLAYQQTIQRCREDVVAEIVACPLFVPLVEDGWQGTDVVQAVATKYLGEFATKPDRLILGCTHYPMLMNDLRSLLPDVTIIDSAVPTARIVHALIQDRVLSAEPSCVRYYATDVGTQFRILGESFLGTEINVVEEVRLDA